MVQILTPVADEAAGSWSNTPLWSKVDDDSTVNPTGDGTTIASDAVGNNTQTSTADLQLASGSSPQSGNHVIRARWNHDMSGRTLRATCELWQGVPDSGSLIATLQVDPDVGSTETESTYTLTSGEVSSISDYTSLYLRLYGFGTGGGPSRSLVVDLVELEIPDAGGSPGSVSPGALSTSASLPASSVSGGGSTSPAAIDAPASVPGPAVSGGGSVAPSAVSPAMTLPAVSTSGSGGSPTITGFDPDPVLDKLKPPPWNVEQAFVNPAHQGLWRNLTIFHPLWEGSAHPYDVTGDADGVFPSTPPSWIPTRVGVGLSFDESDDYYTISDSPKLYLNTDPGFTLAFYMRVPDNTGSAYQYFYSYGPFEDTDSLNLYISEDSEGNPGQLNANANDAGSSVERVPSVTGIFPSDDYKMVILRGKGQGPSFSWWVDGVNVTGTVDSGTLVQIARTDALNVGRRVDGNVDRYFGGEIAWWGKWDRALSETEMRTLTNDPYALFRPNWDSVTAVAEDDDATVTPGATDLTATLPASTPTVPASTTPSVTDAGLTIPASSPAGAANVSPSAITSSVVVPQVSPTGGGTVTPAATELAASIHAVTTATGGSPGTATPDELAAQLSLAQASPVGAANVTPAALSAALNLPAVDAEGLTLVSPAALETAVSLHQVSLVGAATVTVDALELEVVFGVPTTGEPIDHPTGKTSVTLDASTTDAGVVASITSVSLAKSRTFITLDESRTDT